MVGPALALPALASESLEIGAARRSFDFAVGGHGLYVAVHECDPFVNLPVPATSTSTIAAGCQAVAPAQGHRFTKGEYYWLIRVESTVFFFSHKGRGQYVR